MKIQERFILQEGLIAAFLVSTALIAGTKRYIHHFPGSSRKGLLFQSGTQSLVFLIANNYFKGRDHNLRKDHWRLSTAGGQYANDRLWDRDRALFFSCFVPIIYYVLNERMPKLPKAAPFLGTIQSMAVFSLQRTFFISDLKSGRIKKLSNPPFPTNQGNPQLVKIFQKKTMFEVKKDLNISDFPKNGIVQGYVNHHIYETYLKKMTFFSNNEATESRQGQVLGRFDCVAMSTNIKADHEWNDSYHIEPFKVLQGSAINGKEDFENYKKGDGTLDEKKYLTDMGKIFHLMLSSQNHLKTIHAIWGPFGMGEFLSKLPSYDSNFADAEKLNELRQEIAGAFIEKVKAFPNMKIHLCLPKGDTEQELANYNAFLSQEKPENVEIHENEDAPVLAQHLIDKNCEEPVCLANETNRNMIGGHWFEDRETFTTDESLHIRSDGLASLACAINSKGETGTEQWITDHGGKSVTL